MSHETNKIDAHHEDVAIDPELRNDSNEARMLPLLPVRDTVLFPHAVLPLTVGRESSVQLINSLGDDKT
ncbi:MAG TPA: LON peptidase substrate-binding domain-containing protein, partial [Candidatus Angelobacter sp.]|nr:LON peptidase substrate-binding domain-containing protein [Candidatus Angelobacter sp.]